MPSTPFPPGRLEELCHVERRSDASRAVATAQDRPRHVYGGAGGCRDGDVLAARRLPHEQLPAGRVRHRRIRLRSEPDQPGPHQDLCRAASDEECGGGRRLGAVLPDGPERRAGRSEDQPPQPDAADRGDRRGLERGPRPGACRHLRPGLHRQKRRIRRRHHRRRHHGRRAGGTRRCPCPPPPQALSPLGFGPGGGERGGGSCTAGTVRPAAAHRRVDHRALRSAGPRPSLATVVAGTRRHGEGGTGVAAPERRGVPAPAGQPCLRQPGSAPAIVGRGQRRGS